jgi:hypothetical protein
MAFSVGVELINIRLRRRLDVKPSDDEGQGG